MTTGAWLLGDPPHANLKPRLFCFPHAGGGAASFVPWRSASQLLDVQPIRLPGREGRIREPTITRMDELVELLVEALRPYAQGRFALFGHSLGALVAFELGLALEHERLFPRAVFVSGRTSPGLPEVQENLHKLSTDELAKVLREISATPDEVLANPELLALILPAVRADFELVDGYRCDGNRTLTAPLVAYFGEDDPWGDQVRVAMWRKLASGRFRCRGFAGGHFFPYGLHGREVLADIEREIGQSLRGEGCSPV